jgi:hypothetical protein
VQAKVRCKKGGGKKSEGNKQMVGGGRGMSGTWRGGGGGGRGLKCTKRRSKLSIGGNQLVQKESVPLC